MSNLDVIIRYPLEDVMIDILDKFNIVFEGDYVFSIDDTDKNYPLIVIEPKDNLE